MLTLNNREIEQFISYGAMLETIETAYDIYEKNAYHMPDRFHVDYISLTPFSTPLPRKERRTSIHVPLPAGR